MLPSLVCRMDRDAPGDDGSKYGAMRMGLQMRAARRSRAREDRTTRPSAGTDHARNLVQAEASGVGHGAELLWGGSAFRADPCMDPRTRRLRSFGSFG